MGLFIDCWETGFGHVVCCFGSVGRGFSSAETVGKICLTWKPSTPIKSSWVSGPIPFGSFVLTGGVRPAGLGSTPPGSLRGDQEQRSLRQSKIHIRLTWTETGFSSQLWRPPVDTQSTKEASPPAPPTGSLKGYPIPRRITLDPEEVPRLLGQDRFSLR